MNDEQKKHIADCLKLAAVGQLGVIGFAAITSAPIDWSLFSRSVFYWAAISIAGALVLD